MQRRNWKIPGVQRSEKAFVEAALEGNLGKISNKDVTFCDNKEGQIGQGRA